MRAPSFFLVDAFARDLLPELRRDFKAQKATSDVNFGSGVS
jgi:predicted nucleotidyltransferase